MGEPVGEHNPAAKAAGSAPRADVPMKLQSKFVPGGSSAPAAAPRSDWVEGQELEDLLYSMTNEHLRAITWLEEPPEVARGRNAQKTVVVIISGRMALCPLVGVGTSRCVYTVGSRYAIKYEHGHPDEVFEQEGGLPRGEVPSDVAVDH